MIILKRPLNPTSYDHHPGLAADLVLGNDLFLEVVHYYLGFESDGMLVPLNIAAEFLLGLPGIELRVVLHCLGELVIARHRCV